MPAASHIPAADCVPVSDAQPLPVMQTRPTFHVSRELVCFLGGVGVALAIVYLVSRSMKGGK